MNPLRQFLASITIILLSTGTTLAQEKIAFLAIDHGYWQVWLMDADGQNPQLISRSPYDKSRLSWYPDNNMLLVAGNQGELVKLNLRQKTEIPVTIKLPQKKNPPNDTVLSPDGHYLAFSQIPVDDIYSKLWLYSLQTGQSIAIGRMRGFQHEPVFSADSQQLYFLSGNNQQNHDIWRYSLSGQSLEKMTHEQLYNLDVSLSPSHNLAFSSNRSGNYEIWITDAKGIRRLTQHAALDARPSWSADEKTVAFESTRSGIVNIWRVNPELPQSVQQLTDFKEGARYPLYQPQKSDTMMPSQ